MEMNERSNSPNGLYSLKRRRLSEDVSNQLKDAIYQGNFKPGDKLPSENALREIFMVGRPVVREALRFLENSGMISVRPGAGGGAFVKKISANTLSETFEGIIKLDQVSMEGLTEARLAVEMSLLPLIIERIQPGDLKALENNIVEANESLEKGIEEPKNLEFHILLAQASHNQMLIKISEGLLKVMARLLKAYPYSYERKKVVLEEHQALLDLLQAKKYKALERALADHIEGTLSFFDRP
jgi:DNA-binding FadR family transcriptional regulator